MKEQWVSAIKSDAYSKRAYCITAPKRRIVDKQAIRNKAMCIKYNNKRWIQYIS